MKFNTTVALTLILLAMMLGAGFVSAMWGFTLGHEALKGVTQPDVRPTKKLADNKQVSPGKEGVPLLREEDILTTVNEYINNKSKDLKTDNKDPQANNSQSQTVQKPSPEPSSTPESLNADLKVPIKSQDRGVTLEVRSASQQGGSLLLNVSLKNDGANAVRFLYSFLNVTDDQGRALSAITEGLPGELPPNGQEFSGTVSIPTALLENAKRLSLTLTDYPDQKLQLKMSEIPVVR
jgi:outer membrane biosynthesis protein TonB